MRWILANIAKTVAIKDPFWNSPAGRRAAFCGPLVERRAVIQPRIRDSLRRGYLTALPSCEGDSDEKFESNADVVGYRDRNVRRDGHSLRL
jgi:hypothetical protein